MRADFVKREEVRCDMFKIDGLLRVPRTWRYAAVGAVAFCFGSATVAYAAPAIIGSIFYLPLVNGIVSTPCNNVTTPVGTTTTCNAVVDQRGQVAVSDADTHSSLSKLQYDAGGNLKVTSQGTSTVSGSVSVSNFPTTQSVTGTVKIDPSGNTVRTSSAAPQPFIIETVLTFSDGQSNLSCCGFTVPAGKRLVIEFVSVRSGGGAALTNVMLSTYVGSTFAGFDLALDQHQPVPGVSQLVKIYADGGTRVGLQAGRNGSSGSQNVVYDISGTLFDQ
jgi:hypothetical protein